MKKNNENLEQQLRAILEEARVVIPGVQTLLGFQLIAVFNQLFPKSPTQSMQYWHPGSMALTVAKRIAHLKARCRRAGIPAIYVNDNFGRWRSGRQQQQRSRQRGLGNNSAPGNNNSNVPGKSTRVRGTFNGDYTIVDGDKHYPDDDSVPLTPNRAYYESTFSKAYIKSTATKPSVMQGICYAGHLLAGRANNLTLFGSIVAHDEGILTDVSAKIIYDPRVSPSEPKTYINLFLPSNSALDIVYCPICSVRAPEKNSPKTGDRSTWDSA